MPKEPTIEVDDLDDGEFNPRRKPFTRQFDGDDDQVVDAETGEQEFDDIDPRFRNAADSGDDDEDQDEDDLDDEDEDKEPRASDEDEDESKDDEDEDEEEEDFPKNRRDRFRERLDRERRLREEEREDNRELRDRLNKLESNLRIQADDESFTRTKNDLEAKLVTKRAELKAAIEAGETDEQVRLNEELSDLKGELRQKTTEHERAKEAAKKAAEAPVQSPIVRRKVHQWMRKHPRYNSDPEFNALVRATDRTLMAEGFDPETPEFYEQLDKRLKKRFPEEYKGQRDDERERPRRKHPSANIRRGNEKPSSRGGEFVVRNGRVKLTPRQVANMRTFGLDPTNADDRKAYYENNRNNGKR